MKTYSAWLAKCKRLAKTINCDFVIVMGDKDIGECFFHWAGSREGAFVAQANLVGEWDGEDGKLLKREEWGKNINDNDGTNYYKQLKDHGKWIEL